MTKLFPILGLLAILIAPRPAAAQSNYSLASGTTIWTNGGGGWYDTTLQVPVTWNNSLSLNAAFANSTPNVTVNGGVTAFGLQFYQIYTLNGGTITLANPQNVGGAAGSIFAGALTPATINSTIAGSAGLVKYGVGTLVLGGTNVYSGTTDISSGTLQVNTAAALGTSSVLLNSDGLLKLNHSGTTTNAMSLTGPNPPMYTFGHTPTLTGNITTDGVTGTVFLRSNYGTDGAHNLTFNGNTIALGPKAFAVTGNGVNSEADSENSKTTLNNVTLTTASDVRIGRGTLQIQGTTSLTIGGQLQSGPVGDWARFIMGPGTSVTATGGVNMAANGVIASSLYLNGGTLTTPSIVGNHYAGVTHVIFNGVTVVATQDAPNFLQVQTDGNGNFLSGPGELANSGLTLNTNGFTVAIQTVLQDLPGFSGGLTKTGTGALTLTRANTYSGITTVSGGTLRILNGAALGVGGFSGTALTKVQNGGTLTIDGSFTIPEHFHIEGAGAGGTGALRVLSGHSTITAPIALENNGTGPVVINTLAGTSLTLASHLYVDAGVTAGFAKIGPGTLVLAASNTYTGFTIIAAGTVQLGNTLALPGGSTLRLQSGTLSTAGFSNSTGPLNVDGTGTIELGTGSHTLSFAGFDPTNFVSLTITGWTGIDGTSGTAGRIVFTNAMNLTPAVLDAIHFDGFGLGALVIGGNELVPATPIPEPATALGFASLALGAFVARRYRK